MTKSAVVHIIFSIIPRRYFDKWRRVRPLCAYNFHSPVRIRHMNREAVYFEAIASCVHCGSMISRGHDRQWRAVADLSEPTNDYEIDSFETATFPELELERT